MMIWQRTVQTVAGNCYFFGTGTKKDLVKAASFYRKAADRGDPSAEYNLGFCYEMGFGVEKDFTAAKKWYRRAADKSHTNALKALTRLV